MVVAKQRWVHRINVLAEIIAICGGCVARGAEFFGGATEGEEVDVGKVPWITLPDVGHESGTVGKCLSVRLIRDKISVGSRRRLIPVD